MPFAYFRRWLRQGPGGERMVAGLTAASLLAFLAWSAIPVGDGQPDLLAGPSSSLADRGRPAAETEGSPRPATDVDVGSEGTANVNPVGNTTGERDAAAGPGGESAAGGSVDGCAGLRATDQGVSAREIFVAVPVINLAGEVGNQTIGLRGNVEEVAHAVAAGINAEGGVACRKIRIKVYKVNPLDQNEKRARCLEIVADKPFAVIDIAAYLDPVGRSCFVQAKIPFHGVAAMNEDEAADASPYLFSLIPSRDRQARNWVLEAAARGGLDPISGLRKLGLLLDECSPNANRDLLANLERLRVQTSVFTLGGCASINSPSEVGQALVKHRNEDTSHVLLAANAVNSQNYVRQADGVRWKPVYLTSDFGNGTLPWTADAWPDGFDGTLAITSFRTGERNSGMVHPEVSHCNDWLTKAHVRPSESEADEYTMSVCDSFRLFSAASDAAGPDLVRTTLVPALARVGRLEGAFNGGGVFDRPGKVTGGDFVRAIQWQLACRCWKLVDRDMKPAP